MKYLSTNDFTIATNTPEVRSSISELTQKKGHKKDYTKSTRALNNDTIRRYDTMQFNSTEKRSSFSKFGSIWKEYTSSK